MCRMNFLVPPNDKFGGAAVDGEIIGPIFIGTAMIGRGTVCDGQCSLVDLARRFRGLKDFTEDHNGIDMLLSMVNVEA